LSGTGNTSPSQNDIHGQSERKPRFSIIMATYNRAHLLPRAVTSILGQTYQNFELIIIDDGSSDNTDEVVESFRGDNRVICYKNKENAGLEASLNKGLDSSSEDYVIFLDDDDELLSDTLETAVDKFAALATTGVRTIRFDGVDALTGKVTGRGIDKDGYMSYEDQLCGVISGNYLEVIDRSLFGEFRFDEKGWGETASLLWLKVLYQAKVFHVAKAAYIDHKEHGNTISRDFRGQVEHRSNYLWTQKTFLQEYGEELKRLCPSTYGRKLVSLGLFHLLNGEKSEGLKALCRSLKFCLSFRAIILILLSLFFSEKQLTSICIKFADVGNGLKNFINGFRRKTHPGV